MMVVRGGVEPPTFRFSGGQANYLSEPTAEYRLTVMPLCTAATGNGAE
jgi:hypothetical protein